MDSTRTFDAKVDSNAKRHADKGRQAQRRIADKSFTTFMREHNRSQSKKG